MDQDNQKPKLTFYILSKTTQDQIRDFQQFLYDLRERWFLSIIQKSSTQASLSNNMGYSSEITLVDGTKVLDNQSFPFAASLVISPEDEPTFSAIRQFLWYSRIDYKLYSESYQSFIPKDPELIADDIGNFNKEVRKSLGQFNLKPVYFYQKTKHYYALTADGTVAIVNRYLLDFLYKKEIPEQKLDELSYVVSPNLRIFAGLFEKGLVPTKFYDYYGRDFKIINESHINILNSSRKVFVKPLIFEFNQEAYEFYTYASDSSSSLLAMDKIRVNESLNDTILRVLKDELKIADNYIGAHVEENIEFDRDKEGIMTPRLIVRIYVDKIKNKDWANRMSQTSWRSVTGKLSTPPPREQKKV
ncbi:MAG TPA: hypothetical protein VMW41_05635 [Candidatus Bathyarchaeia archaeon]|nr:hypothetical protein [Candidatus Bathyarchaeia archaeon]